MANFIYKASDASGRIIDGNMEAREKRVVVNRLREKGFFPIKIETREETRKGSVEISFKKYLGRIRSKDVMSFAHQLATLTDSGIPLDRSLSICLEVCSNTKLKGVIQSVQKSVQGGSSFAEALAKHPRVFSKLFVNMVRAGEAGGVIEVVLARLAEFLEKAQELKDYISSALAYPIIVIFVGGIAVTVMLTFVIPQFTQIFADMGKSLPATTQFLINASDFFKNYWWIFFGSLTALILGFNRWIDTEKGRLIWDGWKFHAPLIGDFIQKLEVSRFARTFGTLLNSGVPVLNALMIVRETLTNQVIRLALLKKAKTSVSIKNGAKNGSEDDIISSVKRGKGISKPLLKSKVFPPIAMHMITVGEESGQLEKMLLKVASTYEEEVRLTVKKLVVLFEPLVILFLGGLVAFIIFSLLMAILSINEINF